MSLSVASSNQNNVPAAAAPETTFRLAGPWRWLGQISWASIFALSVFFWSVGAFEWYNIQHRPCDHPLHKGWEAQYCEPYYQAIADLGLSPEAFAAYTASLYLIAGIPHLVLSFVFARRRPDSALVIWLAIWLAVVGSMGKWMNALPLWATTLTTGTTIDLTWLARFMIFMLAALGTAIFFAFPDGRFVPRWMLGVWLIWLPANFLNNFFPEIPLDYGMLPEPIPQLITLCLAGVSIFAMYYRYTRVADSAQRQQLKWFYAGLALVALMYIVDFSVFQVYPWVTGGQWLIREGMSAVVWELIQGTAWAIVEVLLAVCVGLAVFRHRLLNIDIIINRALVYSTLSLVVIGMYVALVGILGSLIQTRSNLIVSIITTGLIAVLVQPIRDRLQRSVNRLMYGERDDPITVLARLGSRLETALAPNAVLPAVAETVAQTLKLPYAAILWSSGETAAAFGTPVGESTQLPLSYQGEVIGQLVVSPRAPNEPLAPLDVHLLQNIAHQAGAALHAVSLTAELQHARRRLVNVLEDERRRLRRDLHDGLGPALASQGLKLAAIQQLMRSDPASAQQLLEQVMTQNRTTIDNVRQLVYGLRPPALDERGLVEAIRDHSAQTPGAGLAVEVGELPDGLPPLPAAVEIAVYRIVLEALTNTFKHAQARRCTVRFARSDAERANEIQVEISDDGMGVSPAAVRGIGLRSMRERAEELGGRLVIKSAPNRGTTILAQLPIGA